ncbi:MAG: hypothetical protein AAF304_00660 [Pseudomonadota bacterium]
MKGPLKFKIVSFDGSEDREVHVDFKEEFQKLSLSEQATQFDDHINSLKSQAAKLSEDSQERQGIVFVLEFLEELAPRIQAGEIPLNETIIVKVMEQPPLKQLISKLDIN